VEFEEMQLPSALREMSIADASYVLEASKDILIITLVAFNGSLLHYVELSNSSKCTFMTNRI